MADILSLSKVRKAKARADKETRAAANRKKFGQSKAERQQADAEKALAERRIEAHKRED